MAEAKKYNKCPHCKSKKGFMRTTYLSGYQDDSYSFNGKLLNTERHGADKSQEHVVCLNCDKSIPAENVRIKDY